MGALVYKKSMEKVTKKLIQSAPIILFSQLSPFCRPTSLTMTPNPWPTLYTQITQIHTSSIFLVFVFSLQKVTKMKCYPPCFAIREV